MSSCSLSDMQGQLAAAQAEVVSLCQASEDLVEWLAEMARHWDE